MNHLGVVERFPSDPGTGVYLDDLAFDANRMEVERPRRGWAENIPRDIE
jgi:hypothetical protein